MGPTSVNAGDSSIGDLINARIEWALLGSNLHRATDRRHHRQQPHEQPRAAQKTFAETTLKQKPPHA